MKIAPGLRGWPLPLLLAACAPQTFSGNTPVSSDRTNAQRDAEVALSSSATPGQSASKCPSQDFEQFASAFADDPAVQRTYTQDPLIVVEYDPQALEAEPTRSTVHVKAVKYPLLISPMARDRMGVRLVTARKDDGLYELSTYTEGAGAYSKTFHFKHKADCYVLVEVTDIST